MSQLKYYNGSAWVAAVVGAQGPTGPTGAASTVVGPTGPTGPSYLGVTSTTSTTVSIGSTTYTVTSTGAFAVGTRVRVASTASPANWEEGIITALVLNTSITVNVDLIGGSGTFAAWTFSVAGSYGPTGAAATVAVGTTTSTGPAGTPSVTNSGTSSAAVLDFLLKQGPTGPTGPSGDPTLTVQADKTAAYTVALTDASQLIPVNSASALIVSIPTDASVAFPTGTQINILRKGTGLVTIAAVTPGTTTVSATPGLKLRAQWSTATLIKHAANAWVVVGDLLA